MSFGISTHLYVADRLERDHLVEIAAHGFDAVEVFGVRNHFDYRDRRAAIALAEWLDDTRLRLHSMHAPIAREYGDGSWPDGAPADNQMAALVRSLEELWPAAERHRVSLAVEVIPNTLSTPSSLVGLVESEIEARLGICMDVGHARLMGDVVDAIEACSGHVITTHLHDNRGRNDDHLMPGKGVIDWDAALVAFQKVGYDGVWMFELGATPDRRRTLEAMVKVRERFESLLKIGDEMMGLDET
jgi:sugar phosphate isomerase/epimerase